MSNGAYLLSNPIAGLRYSKVALSGTKRIFWTKSNVLKEESQG